MAMLETALLEGYKRACAINLLDGLWEGETENWQSMDDALLYEWCEVLGYKWNGSLWVPEPKGYYQW
jgi:hypothetical protein